MREDMADLIADSRLLLFTSVLVSILLMHLGISSDAACPPLTALDEAEAQALRDAAWELGKRVWNSIHHPCDDANYSNGKVSKWEVTCECLDNGWHVTAIALKGQNLTGSLPSSLAKLPYLKTIDLSRNILSGPIPEEWASMKNVKYLSLAMNRLSGLIPRYFGNIISLTYISVESNMFAGVVPAELGKLVNLQTLILSDNNLTGQLPEDLRNLSNLSELRLSSNNFSGRLPDFFSSWTKLRKLEIEGSGFEGPIPQSISLLNGMKELRISDLNGEGSQFPSSLNVTSTSIVVLRNCNISGPIPDYMKGIKCKILDLSFNKLDGHIPNDNIDALQMYLSHNMLTGAIPDWIKKADGRTIDLSYNSLDNSDTECHVDSLNFYRSFSMDKNLESIYCLKNTRCSKARYSLHINCGGEEIKVGKTTYEKDNNPGGAAKFVQAMPEWGFSSSGAYLNTNDTSGYTETDYTTPSMKDTKLYADARFAATYLTYYGLCFAKGNYSVTLLFSELFFRNDLSFSSLGRRKFDIYIQDKIVCKDFDITTNGGHVSPVFRNIQVNGTLEVRLYYAGKGSKNIPLQEKGVYGPLISAISVDPEFETPLERERVMWISIGAASLLLCLVIIVLAVLRWKHHCKGTLSREEDLVGLDLQTGVFSFRQIRAATNNFDEACKIGEGGFGSVYLGRLLDGTCIAVKQLSPRSSQGIREFVNEIGIIAGLQHPNLVRLYGCCVEGSRLFLIYEYVENNNLALSLFGAGNGQLRLDWPTRQRICIGVARGLTYLHEDSAIKIVHRDIKATNILLDRDLNAKISDFGLARLHEEQNTHISTRIAGTIGYMAPEYALWGYLTFKADVYSFGVVLLEIVAGRTNMKQPDGKHMCLLDKAFVSLQQKQNLLELMDPTLGIEYREEEALRIIKVALLCTNPYPELRPTMSAVVSMLEGNLVVPEPKLDPNIQNNEWLYQACRVQHDQMVEKETQSLILSSGAPANESSSSSHHDLYPVNPLALAKGK